MSDNSNGLCLEDCLVVTIRPGTGGVTTQQYADTAFAEFDALKRVLSKELGGAEGEDFESLLSSLREIKAKAIGLNQDSTWQEILSYSQKPSRNQTKKRKKVSR